MDVENQNPPVDAGQQPAAEVQAPQTEPVQNTQTLPAEPPAGFVPRERIDQLTQQLYELREQTAQKDSQMMELMARIAMGQQQPPPQEQFEIDPDQRKLVQAVVSPELQAVEQRQSRIEQMLQQMMFQQQLAQVQDPEVQKLATGYMQAWVQQGKSGWVPQDAVTYALGVVAQKRMAGVNTAQAQRAQANAAVAPPVTAHRAPPPTTRPAAPTSLDFDNLTAEQIAALEADIDGQTF